MTTINGALSTRAGREELVGDVLDELTSIRARDWMGAMRKWHEGSLSMVHLQVVMLLRSSGPLPMSRLAELLDVSVASATGIIDRMEKRGVVERRHSDSDRRVVEVHLTTAGTGIFSVMDTERRRHLRQMLEHITDDDLAALLRGMRAFRVAREQVLGEQPPGEARR
jgi:DNA-binding MarR family transcriptional regulator